MESPDKLVEVVSPETQVYLEVQEKEVWPERREREDLQELESEDKEVSMGPQDNKEGQELDPQVLLAPLGLVDLQVARVILA